MKSESAIQSEIRLALGQRNDVMLIRINVGKFRPLHGDQERVIQSAPPGTPDLLGVWRPSVPRNILDMIDPQRLPEFLDWVGGAAGRALAIEVKNAKGRQRPEQVAFQKAWQARGGVYILARSVEDVIQRINEKEE